MENSANVKSDFFFLHQFSECCQSCRLISWLLALPPHSGSGFSSCLIEYVQSHGINCLDKRSLPLDLLKCQTPRVHGITNQPRLTGGLPKDTEMLFIMYL